MFRKLFLILFSSAICQCANVDIWGPGLHPDKIVLPARYFFVSVNEVSSSPVHIEDLDVKITGASSLGSCRLWVDKLNRNNGSFIIRYRLYETCENFEINVKYKQSLVGNSPYSFPGPIYHENCDCPVNDFASWAKNYQCHEDEQITNDMKYFNNVNMTEVYQSALKQFDNPGGISLCYYVIKNNELFRKCFGKHVGFHIFSDAILQSVLRKVVLPDQSFFINLGDWPLVNKKTNSIVPIFSWCGSDDTYDIVLPTYDLTEATLENMGRVMKDMLSVQGNINKKWDEKIPLAFWRGRDSREERLHLIDIARKYPDLYNASLTNFFFFRHKETEYGPKVPHVSFFHFFDYKYQINIDGSVASYRFPYLLVGDSVVFKQDSSYYEHFYKKVKPGVHYIPFKNDLSDLTEKIKWAMDHDEEAQLISKRGREFAINNLLPKDIICYYANALNEWSSRLTVPIAFDTPIEKVDQEPSNCVCSTNNILNTKDEL